MRQGTVKFIIFIAFILAAFVTVRYSGLGGYLDQERLRAWVDGYGVWGPFLYIIVYTVATSLMFPGLVLTVIGGVVFGPFWGSVYVMAGATIGASIAFFIARYMGRDWVAGMVKEGRLAELDRKVERQGWKIVAFTRLIPLFPFNFLNYAFGLTRIKFIHYLVATFIFMIPGVVAYVVFSSSILDLFKGVVSREFVIGAALLIAITVVTYLYKRRRRPAG